MLSSLVGHGTDEHVEFNYVRDFVRNMWNCRGFESGCEPETSCVPVTAAPAQLGDASPQASRAVANRSPTSLVSTAPKPTWRGRLSLQALTGSC